MMKTKIKKRCRELAEGASQYVYNRSIFGAANDELEG